jgi:hypothetical protein
MIVGNETRVADPQICSEYDPPMVEGEDILVIVAARHVREAQRIVIEQRVRIERLRDWCRHLECV